MSVSVLHDTVADGSFSTDGALHWDAPHTITGLGSAAETSASDYATAAQGAKADSALQANPNIGAATGASISLSGTASLANSGAAATVGTLTLVGGTKTINTTAATSSCIMFFQRKTAGGTIGFATTYTISAGVSFTLSSDSALDTSIYNWLIIETH